MAGSFVQPRPLAPRPGAPRQWPVDPQYPVAPCRTTEVARTALAVRGAGRWSGRWAAECVKCRGFQQPYGGHNPEDLGLRGALGWWVPSTVVPSRGPHPGQADGWPGSWAVCRGGREVGGSWGQPARPYRLPRARLRQLLCTRLGRKLAAAPSWHSSCRGDPLPTRWAPQYSRPGGDAGQHSQPVGGREGPDCSF